MASLHKSAYVASKHGVIGLTRTVALETAQDNNLTCNAICPGWVRTPLVEAQIQARADASGKSVAEEAEELLSEKQPSKQFVRPEDLGQYAAFLCGDHAQQMTGQSLTIDGGWTSA